MKKKDTPMLNDGAAVPGENPEDTAYGDTNQDADDGEGNQESGGDADDGWVSESEPSKILTAICPILYLSHQYKAGDELPANDPGMVDAWIGAGTAVWATVKQPDTRARLMTATMGLPGQAAFSGAFGGNDLVGKVPMTLPGRR